VQKKNLLEQLNPTQVFVFGLVEGVLVLCTIGFFILLAMVLGDGKTIAATSDGGRQVSPSAAPAAGNPTQGDITLRSVDEKNDHIRGTKDAAITIVEYSDFQCPYCQQFHETMKQVMETYAGNVRWVYRHFPLESIHPNARQAALGSECAAEQGKFWEYADATFSNQSQLASGLTDIARQAGLNAAKFETCLSSGKYDDLVDQDATEAQLAGGRGTPYSILIAPDGTKIPISGAQPFASVQSAIEPYLN